MTTPNESSVESDVVAGARGVMEAVLRGFAPSTSSPTGHDSRLEDQHVRDFVAAMDRQTFAVLQTLPAHSVGKRGGFKSALPRADARLLPIAMIHSWACHDDYGMLTEDAFFNSGAGCDASQLGGGVNKTGKPCMTYAAGAAVVGMLSPRYAGSGVSQALQKPDGGASIKTDVQSGQSGLLDGVRFICGNSVNTYAGEEQLINPDSRLSYEPSGTVARRTREAKATLTATLSLFGRLGRQGQLLIINGSDASRALPAAVAALGGIINRLTAQELRGLGVQPRTLDFQRQSDDDDDTRSSSGVYMIELLCGSRVLAVTVESYSAMYGYGGDWKLDCHHAYINMLRKLGGLEPISFDENLLLACKRNTSSNATVARLKSALQLGCLDGFRGPSSQGGTASVLVKKATPVEPGEHLLSTGDWALDAHTRDSSLGGLASDSRPGGIASVLVKKATPVEPGEHLLSSGDWAIDAHTRDSSLGGTASVLVKKATPVESGEHLLSSGQWALDAHTRDTSLCGIAGVRALKAKLLQPGAYRLNDGTWAKDALTRQRSLAKRGKTGPYDKGTHDPSPCPCCQRLFKKKKDGSESVMFLRHVSQCHM